MLPVPARRTLLCSLSLSRVWTCFDNSPLGTWSERLVVSEDNIIPVPRGVSAEIASVMLNTAGIAYRLLNDFTQLKAGDVVLQNDACCPVGLAVIQLCKQRGIKTINIVKDRYVLDE